MKVLDPEIKAIKQTFNKIILSFLISFFIALISFYYTTRTTLDFQEKQIKELKEKIDYLICLHVKP
jgi:putative effector of murein hydrolase LrgA (UPF0299 family)